MNEVALTGLLLICLMALSNWRAGIHLAVVVAFLQDPIRKIVPEQPPFYILLCGCVFGAAVVGAMRSGVPLGPRMVIGWKHNIETAFQLFVFVVLAQALHSLLRYDSPMVALLGVISYLAPFVGLALAHAFAATVGSRGVHNLFLLYIVGAGIGLATLYLEASGLSLPIFGEVGEGIRIYDYGGLLTAYSGTFRAAEIAAWHAAMCSCAIILLMTRKAVNMPRLLAALAVVSLVVALGVLTGRRKFIVMVVIFCAAYAGALGLFWARARAVAIPAAVIGLMVYLVFLLGGNPDVELTAAATKVTPDQAYQQYIQRTGSVFGDVSNRFLELGLEPITWAYNWFGVLGGGVGIGTQGLQHMTQVGGYIGAAEGGLGKIMLELGVGGLLAVALLGWAMIRHIWKLLDEVGRLSPEHVRLACGLVAILLANMASFSIATQTFGDTFILLFLGICLGTLMAIPRMIAIDNYLASRPPRRARLASTARPR